MCNLYSQTTNAEAMRRLFKVSALASNAANLPAQASIFPAYDAPVIRLLDGEQELTMMHWGFALPQRDKAPIQTTVRDSMPVFDTFWKLLRKLRGEVPDVYIYDNIPSIFRVQIVQIMTEVIGDYNDNSNSPNCILIKFSYVFIVETIRKELDVLKLPHNSKHEDNYIIEISQYILNEQNHEYVMSAVELICKFIERNTSKYNYRQRNDSERISREAIDEINVLLKEHGLGYEYCPSLGILEKIAA